MTRTFVWLLMTIAFVKFISATTSTNTWDLLTAAWREIVSLAVSANVGDHVGEEVGCAV